MTADERHFLTGKLERLARLVTTAMPARMQFASEEQFLRMLSLEPIPLQVSQRPRRRRAG
jgi:hypothetical protein